MRRKHSQQCVRGTLSCTATEVGYHGRLVCRFVHEQQVKLESGVGEEEAASNAFWAVRNSGVDIRLNKVCTIHLCCLQLVYVVAVIVSLVSPYPSSAHISQKSNRTATSARKGVLQNLLKELHHATQK